MEYCIRSGISRHLDDTTPACRFVSMLYRQNKRKCSDNTESRSNQCRQCRSNSIKTAIPLNNTIWK
jgi:hypothetical protein